MSFFAISDSFGTTSRSSVIASAGGACSEEGSSEFSTLNSGWSLDCSLSQGFVMSIAGSNSACLDSSCSIVFNSVADSVSSLAKTAPSTTSGVFSVVSLCSGLSELSALLFSFTRAPSKFSISPFCCSELKTSPLCSLNTLPSLSMFLPSGDFDFEIFSPILF